MSGPRIGGKRLLGRRARKRLAWAGAISAVLLLLTSGAVALVSWQASTGLIHPARKTATATPEDVGLAYEDIVFTTKDDVRLVGWWMPGPAPSGDTHYILFLHGWGGNRNQSLDYAAFLHTIGWTVFTFDFRAHGESEGSATTAGLREVWDVEAALNVVDERTGGRDVTVVLYGISMGAAAALNAASDPRVDAVIADSGFAELGNIARNSIHEFTGLPKWPFGPLAVQFASWRVGVDVGDNRPAEAAHGLGKPVLIIQGSADSIVRPGDDGERIAESVGATATYWLVPGAVHAEAHVSHTLEYETHLIVFLAVVRVS